MPRFSKSPLIREVTNEKPKKKKSKIKSAFQFTGRFATDVAKFAFQRAAVPYAVAALGAATLGAGTYYNQLGHQLSLLQGHHTYVGYRGYPLYDPVTY